MLTIEALIKMTPMSVMRRGMSDCRVSMKKPEEKSDKDGEHHYYTGSVKSESIDRIVTIKLYKPDTKNRAKCPAWVHCTCEYFQYTCEVVDTRKHSSSIVLSNGQSPTTRNPNNVPHLCKHLVAFSKVILDSKPIQKPVEPKETKKEQLELPLPKQPPQPPKPKQITGVQQVKLPKPLNQKTNQGQLDLFRPTKT